jgi:ATP-dependent RNA helicase RhlE
VNDVKKILKLTPSKKQTLFFSATMPVSIRKFANTIVKNPVEVSVTPVSSTAKTIEQSVYFVIKTEKQNYLSISWTIFLLTVYWFLHEPNTEQTDW